MSGFLFFSTREKQEKKEEKGGGDIVNELKIEDVKEGEGDGVQEGDTVSVHYKGTLLDGTVFDSSYERGEPFEFTVGEGSVIQGWEEGLIGMRVGGIRKLTIPPELGYGDREAGDIPANSTLIFEIELLEIK
jgi:FKBP-type peptidyl-prolyl cis-trans isomerase